MTNQIILILGLFVLNIIVFVCLLKHFNYIRERQQKIIEKMNQINEKQSKFDSFLIPTYNNSIRIAKKLGVYYCYNKDDFEKHKSDKNEKSL